MLRKAKRKGVITYGIGIPEGACGTPASSISDLYVELAEWKVGEKISYHFQHDTLLYFYSGYCRIIVEDEEFCASPGDILILRGGKPWHYALDSEHLCTLLSVNFRGSLTDELLQAYGLSKTAHYPQSGCGSYCDMLQSAFERDKADYSDLQDEILRFLLLSFQHLSKKRISGEVPIAQTAKKMILNDLYSPRLQVQELAKALNCSPQKLQIYFQQAYGISIRQFIIARRMERVSELMISTPLSLSEIASAVGYANRNYLDRLFIQYYGVSASAFRKLCKEGARPPRMKPRQ